MDYKHVGLNPLCEDGNLQGRRRKERRMFRLRGQSFREVNKGWDFNEEVDQSVKNRLELGNETKTEKRKMLEYDEI